jgi:hypothetical protein
MIFWDPISFNQIVFFPKLQLFFLCLRSPAAYIFWFFRSYRWLKCKLAITGGDETLALLERESNKFSNDILGSYYFQSNCFLSQNCNFSFLCLSSPAAYIFWFFRSYKWLKCKLTIDGGDEMFALLGRESNKFSNDILGSY